MTTLITDNETVITKQDDILNETAEFYKRLYTSEKTDNSSQNFLLNKMTRALSDSDRDECEGEITLDERRKEMFYLTTHSTHFSYGYMASDIWLRTYLIVR